ncbi:MAG: cbb3-type cytochrome c oxidase subunit II [Bryobacteraceae bacterium]
MMFIRLWVFFAGVLATLFLGWAALIGVPGIQLQSIKAQPDLRPYTYEQSHGRQIYIREGCVYCHSQQTRPAGFGSDQSRRWGRASIPGDYVYDRPHLLGTSRTGPDLLNIGVRQPSREWHLTHLYNPRDVVPKSVMPAFPWLFEETDSVDPLDAVVAVPPKRLSRPGVSVIATRDALDLYEYLLGMNRTYPVRRPAPATKP